MSARIKLIGTERDGMLRMLLLLPEVQEESGQHLSAQSGRATHQNRGGEAAVLCEAAPGEAVQSGRVFVSEFKVGPHRLLQEPQLCEEHDRGGGQNTFGHHAPEPQLLRGKLFENYTTTLGAERGQHGHKRQRQRGHQQQFDQQLQQQRLFGVSKTGRWFVS